MGHGCTYPKLTALQTQLCTITSKNHNKLKYAGEHLCKLILHLSAELINLFSESPFTPVISSSGWWRKRRADTEGSYFHPIPLSFWSYLVFSLLFLGEESAKNANDILLISTGRRCSETHSLWWSDKKAVISIRGKMSWNWGSQWKTRG